VAVSAKGYAMADMLGKKPLRMPKPIAPEDEPVKLTPAEMQAYKDAQERRSMEKNPPSTTKTTMGRIFQNGGYVRSADGIATKGKTRGRMC